jgi:hypothetical protein
MGSFRVAGLLGEGKIWPGILLYDDGYPGGGAIGMWDRGRGANFTKQNKQVVPLFHI